MKVTIFGSGYVGLVTGACLAEVGNDVICMDVDSDKIDMLNKGHIPIYEPGLESMVERNAQAGRLRFTTDPKEAVEHGLYSHLYNLPTTGLRFFTVYGPWNRPDMALLPLQPGDVPDTYADVDDLVREFDYKPSMPVKECCKVCRVVL